VNQGTAMLTELVVGIAIFCHPLALGRSAFRLTDEPAVLVEINELHLRLEAVTAQIHDNVNIKVITNDNTSSLIM